MRTEEHPGTSPPVGHQVTPASPTLLHFTPLGNAPRSPELPDPYIDAGQAGGGRWGRVSASASRPPGLSATTPFQALQRPEKVPKDCSETPIYRTFRRSW
ncbi:hypothetical protein GCM10025883_21000 [Mobilicoccus caccae]|uniref:Uncharacterized protein n=1 Tax=Mobilicoccus caccae TaxID=1859295 RepID=A0ABQ6IQ67_9MICO|nr:hypothetical protein GCM10025883_21000 [Mobilicoccus caccae]